MRRLVRPLASLLAAIAVALLPGLAAASPYLALSPAQVAALGGHLASWQIRWLETGGASGLPTTGGSQAGGGLMQRATLVTAWQPTGFQATATAAGTCFSASIAAPRAGAYRCMVGNAILDPCFLLPGGGAVVCPQGDPAKEQGMRITLDGSLPQASSAAPSPAHPWLFTLWDGGTCGAETGTLLSASHTFDCLIPATATAPQQSVYCTAPTAAGPLYTVECAALSAQRAPDGAPQLGPDTQHDVARMWT